ncbi:MAG TPA: tripartite tricarboxylate transporter substrate binding protein [Xanthobacteraceae bacterium]|jgi:tripartite-type tricarboxylate transporter receptor subunit TctC|nr:tripartite tricarboxylate transporter substrate binding protein [Xanthobacteraceae bacterium]
MRRKGAPVAAVALALIALEANAQKWPARPIEMIIPFPAGSGMDVIGRAVASALAEQSGQQVVVNNRDGASGTIGFNALAAATPDGSTIAFGPTTPIANAPYLVKGVRYRVDSFDYICQIFENVFTIAVAPQSKLRSVEDLISAAREHPGKLTYGHAGTGTIPHLAVENFAEALKLKFQPVPFRGDAPVLPTLLKGDIDFGAPAVSTIHGQNFRPLLVFWQARHPAYPDVPIARELGITSEVPPGHNGLYAPSGLPIAARTAFERHCADAVKSDVVRQIITNTGQSIRYLSGADFQSQTVADYQFKGELIHRLGLGAQ